MRCERERDSPVFIPLYLPREWDDTKHNRVFRNVRSVVKKFGVKCFSFAVNKKDYDEVVPAAFRKYLNDHHSWAVYYVVRMCVAWRSGKGVKHPLEWIFDYMKPSDPKRKEVDNIMEMSEGMASASGRAGEYKNFTFRERCDLPGLQCVDALAWTRYQIALHAFTKKDYSAIAETAAMDFDEHMGGSWMHGITILRKDLEEFMSNEINDGTALARFDAWVEKKRLEKEGSRALDKATRKSPQ